GRAMARGCPGGQETLTTRAERLDRLTDLHMIVLSWFAFHPGHTPADIARMLGADADGIAKLCADLAAAGVRRADDRDEVPREARTSSWGGSQMAGKDCCGDSGTG